MHVHTHTHQLWKVAVLCIPILPLPFTCIIKIFLVDRRYEEEAKDYIGRN